MRLSREHVLGSAARLTLDSNQVQTVTVYVTTRQYPHGGPPTNVQAAGGQQTQTAWDNGRGGGGGVVVVGTTTAPVTYNGFCTTIYAQNVQTPTQAPVECGIALVVNDAQRPHVGHLFSYVASFWGLLLALIFSSRLIR